MVFGLQPNEDVTGGAWFTDGVLDEVFIQQLGDWVVQWVASRSWVSSSATNKSTVGLERISEGGGKKKVGGGEDVKGKGKEVEMETSRKKPQQTKIKAATTYLPYPPGYNGYPTVQDVTRAISQSGIIEFDMSVTTTQQLLDVLCYDGHLVKVRDGKAYKSMRTPGDLRTANDENPLTEAPCGRCPVFALCEEGGPINAGNCEYFQEWLEIF